MVIITKDIFSKESALRFVRRYPKPCLVVLLFLLMVIAWGFLLTSPLRYLVDDNFRQQTQAFFYGKFALTERLQDYRWDWALSDSGWHQIWGLGISLVRLPLDLVARVFGLPGIPDMLGIFLFFSLCMVGAASSLQYALCGAPNRIAFAVGAAFIGGTLVLSPGTQMLVFSPSKYNQAIYYNAIWPFFMMALLLLPREQVRPWHWWLLVFACAMQPWFRPTGIFYALGGMAMAALSWRYLPWAQRVWGLGVFCTAIGLLLLTNYLRFGGVLEFGHGMNIPPHLGMGMAGRFHLSPPRPDFWPGLREILHLMFFITPQELQSTWDSRDSWMSGVVRWRELNFRPYSIYDMWAMATAWVWLLVPRILPSAVRMTGITFYILCFVYLLFYARLSIASTRYLVDMMACVQFSWVIWLVVCWRLLAGRGKVAYWVTLAVSTVMVFHGLPLVKNANFSRFKQQFITAEHVERQLHNGNPYRADAVPGRIAPLEYECGNVEKNLPLMYGVRRWDPREGACTVGRYTSVVLRSSPCVELTVETSEEHAKKLLNAISIQSNRVTMGLVRHIDTPPLYRLQFCALGPVRDIGFRQVVVLWYQPDEVYKRSRHGGQPWLLKKIEALYRVERLGSLPEATKATSEGE